MDQIKIGKFIAERRKSLGLTQARLGEMLGITDRAVSKWERGISLPDSSIMLELCGILKITVNDLLCGEVVTVDNYKEKFEQNMLDMVKQKEKSDKEVLALEWIIGIFSIIILLGFTFLASFLDMQAWLRITLIAVGFILGIVGIGFALRIEQTAGYYMCRKCGHRHIPTYNNVLWAMHYGRTRYMKCPKCNKRSWQKKVISKD